MLEVSTDYASIFEWGQSALGSKWKTLGPGSGFSVKLAGEPQQVADAGFSHASAGDQNSPVAGPLYKHRLSQKPRHPTIAKSPIIKVP